MATGERALIVGAGAGLSASLARRCARDGMAVVLAARDTQKLADLGAGDRRQARRLRCEPRGRGRAAVRGGRCRRRAPRPRRLQCQRAGARTGRRTRSGGGRQRDPGDRVRRLSGRPAGGAADDAPGARHDPVHRRQRQRQGLSPLVLLRDGQVRPARPRAKPRARIAAAEHPCRAYRHRRRHRPTPATARERARPRRRCSTRMRSPRPICSCTASTAAPGPGRSSCAPGSRISEAAPRTLQRTGSGGRAAWGADDSSLCGHRRGEARTYRQAVGAGGPSFPIYRCRSTRAGFIC